MVEVISAGICHRLIWPETLTSGGPWIRVISVLFQLLQILSCPLGVYATSILPGVRCLLCFTLS